MPLDRHEIVLRVPTATGRMFFLVDRDGSCYLTTNPSSSGESEITPLHISSSSLKIDLGCRSYNWIRKVVVSDRILAVPYCGMVTVFPRGTASPGARLCWVPPATFPTAATHVDTDIALFQGELYVVLTDKHNKSGSELPELHRLEIGDEQNRVRSVQCIRRTPRNHVDDPARSWTPRNGVDRTWRSVFYLLACGERLLMVESRTLVERFVVWEGGVRERGSRPIRTQLEAWEGVDLIGGHGYWSKVDTLMGHALFVSRGCSQSLPAAQCGAREDCIYFVMTERPRRKREPQDDVFRCVVYNVSDRTMEPLETSEPTLGTPLVKRGENKATPVILRIPGPSRNKPGVLSHRVGAILSSSTLGCCRERLRGEQPRLTKRACPINVSTLLQRPWPPPIRFTASQTSNWVRIPQPVLIRTVTVARPGRATKDCDHATVGNSDNAIGHHHLTDPIVAAAIEVDGEHAALGV
ncbi:hypothetical protein TRIUR3_00529 [Triticum urartu]|uniref:KIB1-4 beta-propeller domain-containing protein n=1 Tax=Triticum urartu TaxID=4572 RepID=M8B353_TRIUA|nr:hypothetical protein TRIUR3_00529 [Triticum urartu]